MKSKWVIVVSVCLCLFLSSVVRAEEIGNTLSVKDTRVTRPVGETRNAYTIHSSDIPDNWSWSEAQAVGQQVLEFLDDRLEIGARRTRFSLDTTQSPGTDREIPGNTFLGNLTRIEGEQDDSFKLFITVLPIPYAGLQLTWDGVEARAWNWNTGTSDGTVEASGRILSLLVQYPNRTRFTPYATLGRMSWDADFHEDPWWNYGFSSPESYRSSGSPGRSQNGLQRYITTSINEGSVKSLGLAVRILDYLSADFTYRTVSVNVDASYYRKLGGVSELRRTGNFPLNHSSYAVGLKYVF